MRIGIEPPAGMFLVRRTRVAVQPSVLVVLVVLAWLWRYSGATSYAERSARGGRAAPRSALSALRFLFRIHAVPSGSWGSALRQEHLLEQEGPSTRPTANSLRGFHGLLESLSSSISVTSFSALQRSMDAGSTVTDRSSSSSTSRMAPAEACPPEVLDQIFGYNIDLESIKMCCLVCRHWRDPAQRGLFANPSCGEEHDRWNAWLASRHDCGSHPTLYHFRAIGG